MFSTTGIETIMFCYRNKKIWRIRW